MGIRENYQQTTIGIIPSDWRFEPLKIFCRSSAFGPRFSGNLYSSNGNVATLRTTDLDNNGKINYATMPTAQLDESKFKDHLLCENDFLITRSGTCGIAAVFKSFEKPVLPGAFLIRFRFKDEIDVHFLKYYVNSPVGQRQMEQISLGAVQKNISGTSLLNTSFPFPSLSEQSAIATALNDTDALITHLEKLVAKKRAIKQGAMQELLKPKEGWEVKKLGEVAKFINGRAYALHEWETYGVPVIRLQNLTGSGENYYYSNLKLPEKQYCHHNDLLFMWSASFGPIIWKGEKAIYHYHIWRIETDQFETNKYFLFYILLDLTERVKKSSTNGGTMLHITKKSMEETIISIPQSAEQIRIAQILSDMDAEIAILEKKVEKYNRMKQGMMQELLTGKIRLI